MSTFPRPQPFNIPASFSPQPVLLFLFLAALFLLQGTKIAASYGVNLSRRTLICALTDCPQQASLTAGQDRIDRSLTLDPTSIPAIETMIWYKTLNKPQKELIDFQSGLERGVTRPWLIWELGQLYKAQNRPEQALETWKNTPVIAYELLRLSKTQTDWQEESDLLALSAEIAPDDETLIAFVGNAYLQHGISHPVELQFWYEKARALENNGIVIHDLNYLLAVSGLSVYFGQYEAAIIYADRAILVMPSHPHFYKIRADALWELGQKEGAITAVQQALIHANDLYIPSRYHFRLAQLYEELGQAEKAVQHYNQALVDSTPELEQLIQQALDK